MKLLVNKQDTVEIRIYCWEKEGETEASHLKSDVPQDVNVVEQVDFVFRKPTYADSNAIIRLADIKASGEDLNLPMFQEAILKTLLQDWNIKDENEGKVPISVAAINQLHPNLARAAVSGVLLRIRI